jgi:peptidoglycan/LPS O-acetylase OafA/YrhL
LKRIPTLDGWRGIAIALVLFDHVQGPLHGAYFMPWTQTGRHGVTIFFVLSGFLITTGLIAEPISLKRFYVRRFFRLMPSAWIYLAAVALLNSLSKTPLTSWIEIKSCVLFYRNYYPDGGLGWHFWSLSIEEQFYLCWPLLLLLAGRSRLRWITAIGAASIAAFRILNWRTYQGVSFWDRTEVRADALLIGCLLALLLSEERTRDRVVRWSRLAAAPAAIGFFVDFSIFPSLQPLSESVCIAILLTVTMFNPDARLSRLLSWKPLAQLGLISYSLYVWQELFMWFHQMPQIFAVSVGILLPLFAITSYYLLERPLTNLGRRLTQPSLVNPETYVTGVAARCGVDRKATANAD